LSDNRTFAFVILRLSYSDTLAMDNAVLGRRLIESDWFQERWGDRVQMTADQDAKSKFDTTAGGSRISGSFKGTVTGRGGGIRLYDDPHKMDEVESTAIREGVLNVYNTTLKSRVTDPRISAEVMIAQRGHVKDLSSQFLDDPETVHLNLPAEYDSSRHCVTSIGWEDPRTEDGQLLWPERFGPRELAVYKRNPDEWQAQWQQQPRTKDGDIIKASWWGIYELPVGAAPQHRFDFVVASLDPAYTSKDKNDPSGFNVWGTYLTKTGQVRIVLLHAWKKRLELHGQTVERLPDEKNKDYIKRASPDWGLVEWVAHDCTRLRVHMLLIENKASGHSVAQEIQRLYATRDWGVQLMNPGALDKRARVYAIQHLFAAGMIEAPAHVAGNLYVFRDWAQMVIDEFAAFKGFPGDEDNLVDAASQALAYLRDTGIAIRREEKQFMEDEMARYKPPSQPLYDA
jgi:hypothetical protein